MRAAVGNFRQRRIAVTRSPGRKTLVVKNAGNQITNICFVIDNENVISHGSRLSCQLPVAASIFVSLLVSSAGSVVSDAGGFVFGAGSFPFGFRAWPALAAGNPIPGPPPPGTES